MQEAPLGKINHRYELKEWLSGKPREVAVALAARAALRVLPVLQTENLDERSMRGIVLPVFRATGIAWVAAKYPTQATRLDFAFATPAAAARDAADAAAAARAASARAAAAARAGRSVVYAAARAAAAAAAAAAAFHIPHDVPRTTAYAAEAAAAYAAELWSAVSDDATRVEEGATASDIAGSPLWPVHIVGPAPLMNLWNDMEAALLAEKQDWMVWTTWYRDRLAGYVREEERELAYVPIDDDLWKQGPAVVNAEIKRRIDALPPPPIEVIPDQEPIATRFGVSSEGLIDVVPDPPAPGTATDPLQREYYEETRFKADALLELGPNQLGELNGPVRRFRDGLKDGIEDISITSLWSRGNTLRRRLKAHDLSMNSAEPDVARLPPLVAETLRDLVHTWNVFIVGDAKGRELDEIRLGPQDVEAAKQVVAAATPVVAAIERSENVATRLAVDTLVEQAEAAKNAPVGIDGDQASELSRKTSSNFVAELLRRAYSLCRGEGSFAWKEYRAGIYHAAGDAAYHAWPAIALFVANNAEALKGFVIAAWHNPALVEIINSIIRFSGRF